MTACRLVLLLPPRSGCVAADEDLAVMLLMMHQPHGNLPWRPDRCNRSCVHSTGVRTFSARKRKPFSGQASS